jgi:hypothetical protein
MASSSEDRNFFEPLFCFLAAWLFLGVGEFLKGRAPRCWLKKVAVADADWVCAGDCGAAGADALEEEAAEDGFEDMMPPARGVRDDGSLAQWRLHCSNTKTKAKKSARRGGKDTGGVCGHGLVGLRAVGSPRGLDLESQRVEWRSMDHHDERLDQLTCFCTNNLLPVPSFARAHQLYHNTCYIHGYLLLCAK